MKIPINFGAGGGSGSDDCTAAASDVLAGKTAIYNGTDDEPEAGTLADYSGTTTSAALSQDSTNSRVLLTVPYTGKYDTSAKLYTSYSQMRTLIGYTDASKVLSGTTFLGLAGTMADKSGTTTSATSSLDSSNSRVRLQIPSNGYYNTSAYLYQSYSNIASLIGLTAAKIKYGESILGVTGTWNGYVATTSDIYYSGSQGICGGATAYYSSGSTLNGTAWNTSCLELKVGRSTAGGPYYAGARWANTLNCGAYSTLKLTFNITTAYTGSLSSCYIAIALYSTQPSSASEFVNYTQIATSTNVTSTGSGRTLSLDISGISADRYVGVFIVSPNQSGSYSLTAEVTRVQVS